MARKEKKNKSVEQREFIRLATKDDCSFIRRLSSEVFSLFGDYGEIISRWFENPDVFTVIYVEDGHQLSFAMLHVLSGEILAIAVLPKYRRRGIGSALLAYIEFLASQLRLRRLLLHTAEENNAARLFFQKAGFKAIGTQENYYPKGQTALIISKDI